MSKVLEIGDRSRDNMFEITDTSWDSNGTMRVTVRNLYDMKHHAEMIPAMRRLARRALAKPHLTRSSRVVFTDGSSTTFAVSRLKD